MKEIRGGKVLLGFLLIIVFLFSLFLFANNGSYSGLAVYNFGPFDDSNSFGLWTSSGSSMDGSYSIDNQVFSGGTGSLKGSTAGHNKSFVGVTLSQKLSPNMTQNGEYLNFYWRKSYQNSLSVTNNMSIILLRPDNSKVVLWNDLSNNYDSWSGESVQINSFNQQGDYYLVLGCDLKTGELSDNSSSTSCYFDEVVIDTQGSPSSPISPFFYSYQQTPSSGVSYNVSTVYDFRVSVSNSDGKPWIDLDSANRSLSQVSGNTYRLLASNLSAGTHSFYYWSWNNGGIASRARNSSPVMTYQVTKGFGELKTIINGYRGDYTVSNNTVICFSVIAPDSADGLRTISVNGKLFGKHDSNFQNCTSFSTPQVVNISSYWDGGTNYFSDSESWQLRVIKESEIVNYNETVIKVLSPFNIDYSSDTKFLDFSLVSNTDLRECRYSLNGLESVLMDKANGTSFSKNVITTPGSHQLFFICKDNLGTVFNVQPVINFNVKDQPKVGVIKSNLNFSSVNDSCTPSWKCSEWSDCSAVSYDPSEIISGKIDVRGEQRRICYDTTICKNAVIEKQVCDVRIPVRAEAKFWCEQNYIEIYDLVTNQLVSRIKERDIGNTKTADIGFVMSEFGDYCDYCYNDARDFDEAGIDCGGKNCPACYNKSSQKALSSNALRFSLTIIEVLVLGSIISYLFYWLIVKRLWAGEESEELVSPAMSLVKQAMKRGYSKDQIYELFKKKGWKDRDIDQLIRESQKKFD
ncbi:MAG: hypothetical protein AABW73_00540 [Nanoarchaeota archaeon]